MSEVTKRLVAPVENENRGGDVEANGVICGEENIDKMELHGGHSMRRNLKILREFAGPGIAILFLMVFISNMSIPDALEDAQSRETVVAATYTDMNVNVNTKSHISLWTYAEKPPSSVWKGSAEHVILCSYTSCMDGAKNANNPASRINLRELASFSPIYYNFVRNHMW